MPQVINSSKETKEQSPLEAAMQELAEFSKPFSDYEDVAKDAITGLIESWKGEVAKTDERRLKRFLDVDIEKLKASGDIAKDEVWTPVLLIDSNIRKQQAQKLQYLTKSPRVCIAKCNENAGVDGSPVEKDFTDKARYDAWEMPIAKTIDGCETHGWDTVEIVFDPSKPGHFAIEHNGHDKLFFPPDSKDIQSADFICKEVEITKRDLIKLVKKNNFDAIQVAKLLAKMESEAKESEEVKLKGFKNIKIYKTFFKHDDGFVYIAWSNPIACDGWLREPRKLFLGQIEQKQNEFTGEVETVQLYETSYPIEVMVYSISEDECLMKMRGRVELDSPKAEAATSLLSSALTSFRRASNLYFSSDSDDGVSADEAQTDFTILPNKLFNKKIKQFQLTPVSADIFQAVNIIIGQSQQEAGDMNYAVFSNKSTRKTSAEVKLADKESGLLSGVSATLLSIALRNIYTRCFNIYRSRAIAGLVKVTSTVLDYLTQYTWTLKPAGDTDVLERNEKIKRMQESWPVYQNSPAKGVFLKNLTRLLFPDEAEQYISAIDAGEQQIKFIMGMLEVLKSLVYEPGSQIIKPEYEAESERLAQLIAQGTQLVQQGAMMLNNGTATPAMPSESDGLPTNDSTQMDNILNMPSAMALG